ALVPREQVIEARPPGEFRGYADARVEGVVDDFRLDVQCAQAVVECWLIRGIIDGRRVFQPVLVPQTPQLAGFGALFPEDDASVEIKPRGMLPAETLEIGDDPCPKASVL